MCIRDRKNIKKELLTEETEKEPFEEEDTQDTPVSIAQNPYASPISDSRALIEALSKLGEQQ